MGRKDRERNSPRCQIVVVREIIDKELVSVLRRRRELLSGVQIILNDVRPGGGDKVKQIIGSKRIASVFPIFFLSNFI